MEYILSVDCPDAPGIIHRLTGVLFDSGLNVVSQAEFVDTEYGQFFLRAEFTGEADLPLLRRQIAELPISGLNLRLEERRDKALVVFAGCEAHCIGDLLIRHHSGELHASISAVVSNREDLSDLVKRFDLPFRYIPVSDDDRTKHEQEILAVVKEYNPDLLVLAKYMRILTPEFVEHFPERIINIHHSFLPAFIGAKPYHRAHERGVKIIGATAHFVTPNLDEGPIIAQDVVPVNHRQSVTDLVQAGKDVEKIVLARALRLVAEERVFVFQNRTIVFD